MVGIFLVTNPDVTTPAELVPVVYSVVTTVVGIAVVTGVVAGVPVVTGEVVLSPVPLEHGTVVVIVVGWHPEVVSPAVFVPVEQTVVVIVVVVGVVTEVTVVVGTTVVPVVVGTTVVSFLLRGANDEKVEDETRVVVSTEELPGLEVDGVGAGVDEVSILELDGVGAGVEEVSFLLRGCSDENVEEDSVLELDGVGTGAEEDSVLELDGVGAGVEAVSYTHLDVYKRQIVWFTISIYFVN